MHSDVAYLNDSCSSLSKSINDNREWFLKQFSETQTSLNEGLSKIGQGAAQMKDTMSRHGKKIQNLELQVNKKL